MSESLQVLVVLASFVTAGILIRAVDRFWFRLVSRKYLEPSYVLRILRRATGKRHVWLHIFASRNRMVKVLDKVHPRATEIAEHRVALKLLKGQGDEAATEVARLKEGILQIYDTQLNQDKLDRATHVASLRPALETAHGNKKLGDEADLVAYEESLARQIDG
jgi:hypothetical protein